MVGIPTIGLFFARLGLLQPLFGGFRIAPLAQSDGWRTMGEATAEGVGGR